MRVLPLTAVRALLEFVMSYYARVNKWLHCGRSGRVSHPLRRGNCLSNFSSSKLSFKQVQSARIGYRISESCLQWSFYVCSAMASWKVSSCQFRLTKKSVLTAPMLSWVNEAGTEGKSGQGNLLSSAADSANTSSICLDTQVFWNGQVVTTLFYRSMRFYLLENSACQSCS